MTRSPQRKQAEYVVELINQLLLTRWDPIGVSDVEGAENEYLAYAQEIYSFLARGEAPDFIARHLSFVSTKLMGLGDSPAHNLDLANELVVLWQESRSNQVLGDKINKYKNLKAIFLLVVAHLASWLTIFIVLIGFKPSLIVSYFILGWSFSGLELASAVWVFSWPLFATIVITYLLLSRRVGGRVA